MKRRLLLALVVVTLIASVPVGAQTFNAQIQAFWNQLRTGAIAFATGRVQTSGYLNFGNTVGTSGYGFRDNAGTIQSKNSGGAWANINTQGSNPCPGDGTTYLAQVATNDLGVYTNATACASGTLRFDVSATAVTSAVPFLATGSGASAPGFSWAAESTAGWNRVSAGLFGFAVGNINRVFISATTLQNQGNWVSGSDSSKLTFGAASDIQLSRTAAKTLRIDTDAAGGALTLLDVKGPLTASGVVTAPRLVSATAAPGLSSCGTGSIDSNSTDIGGKVTATGATACTVTFTTAYPTAAWCTITDDTTIGKGLISAQSASAFTVSSLTSGDTFQYTCNGK